jgi:GntR family transcriptional regulator, transcriptional repressor for pyruvate dehydrogenase complex
MAVRGVPRALPYDRLVSNATRDRFSVRVPKTAELVADHIRRQIVSGQLHEGDALPPETALMAEYSISRPTLREAFRILESEGLITVRRGARGGARVQEPKVDVAARYAGLVLQHRGATIADVLEARVIVEAPAVRMLASRRDRASIAKRLQGKLDELELDDPGRFFEFNALVVELTENQTLLLLTTMLEHISTAAAFSFVRAHAEQTERIRLARKAARTRQRLIELIRSGEADEAEALWRTHLVEAGRVLSEGAGHTVLDVFGWA